MAEYISVPFEFPKSADGKYFAALGDSGILKSRRTQLGLTQQEVADKAHIYLSQYQRLESGDNYLTGSSMKIGLSVCAALLLNPYDFVEINVDQPDPTTMRPQHIIGEDIPENLFTRKRAGRKLIRKEIMTVYVNCDDYSLLIPYDILNKLGDPEYIQLRWNISKRRIVIIPATSADQNCLDIPKQEYEYSILAIPKILTDNNPINAMGWDDRPYALEAQLVFDVKGSLVVLIDLKTAVPTDMKELRGFYLIPDCLTDHNNDDDNWDSDADDEYSEPEINRDRKSE